jgi:hypothetical protein
MKKLKFEGKLYIIAETVSKKILKYEKRFLRYEINANCGKLSIDICLN